MTDEIPEIQELNKSIERITKALKVSEDLYNDATEPLKKQHYKTQYFQFSAVIIQLSSQKKVIRVIQKAEKITNLAYIVALVSLGASLISLVASLFR